MKNFILRFFLLLSIYLSANSSLAPIPQTDLFLNLWRNKVVKVLDKNWKFHRSDKVEYSNLTFDDSKWINVKINTPLPEKYRKKYCWYRVSFNLVTTPQKGFYELDLGFISAGDQVFVNGIKLGEYGFAKVVNNSSDTYRKYRFNDNGSILKKGRNVLAIRVKLGYKYGLYDGIPTIKKLDDTCVIGTLNNYSIGKTATFRHISSQSKINNFLPQNRIAIAPKLILYGIPKQISGTLKITIKKGSKVLDTITQKLAVTNNKWTYGKAKEIKNPNLGNYQVCSQFIANDKILWQENTSFTINKRDDYFIKQDKLLANFIKQTLPIKIGDESFGSLGLRDVDKNYSLMDNYNTPDVRSSLGNSYGISKRYSGIVLLHSHIKNTNIKSSDFIDQPGRIYDGFESALSCGVIRPALSNKIAAITNVEHSWTSKKINIQYVNKNNITFTINHLSPAATISTNFPSLLLFESFNKSSVPKLLFIEKQGSLVNAGNKIANLEKNYLVVSFRNAPTFNGFDIPYLLVFEKKPKEVLLQRNSLKISWPKTSGLLQIMPLYGITLQPSDNFEQNILKRCQFWSQALQAMATKVSRTAFVDYHNNRLIVKDTFTRKILKDDWNTPSIKFSPIAPSIILAGNNYLDIRVSHKVENFDYASLNGPIYGVTNSDSYVFSLNNVVHLASEVRKVSKLKLTKQVDIVKKDLLDTVRKEILPQISIHPWPKLISNKFGKLRGPGALEPDFSNLMLALAYLPKDLQTQVINEVKKEAPLFFDPQLKTMERKNGKSTLVRATTQVFNPITKKYLNTSSKHVKTNGIDGPCWEALRLYLMWSSSYYCNNFELLKKNLFEIEKSYNLLVNSHDWAYSLSWDSFAGIRIGNGVQEGTICHAGFTAFARIMHHLGKVKERDKAVYFSLMQLIAISSAISQNTMDFVRNNRQVLGDHPKVEEIAFLDRHFPNRFCEINERAGLFSWVINPYLPYYDGFIMTPLPEVLRPFKDYFYNFSNFYYSGVLNDRIVSLRRPVTFDIFCYGLTKLPKSLDYIFALTCLKRTKDWQKLADKRAYLENNSKVYYEKLWTK